MSKRMIGIIENNESNKYLRLIIHYDRRDYEKGTMKELFKVIIKLLKPFFDIYDLRNKCQSSKGFVRPKKKSQI